MNQKHIENKIKLLLVMQGYNKKEVVLKMVQMVEHCNIIIGK